MQLTKGKNYPLLFKSLFSFTVRVRYAPSPTGPMHLGGLRTALYNYLLAKHHQGAFVLRIEDTDKNREVEGSTQNIFEMMDWMGIRPDESMQHGGQYGPYVQSERLEVYKKIEKELLDEGKAYRCFCSEEQTQNGPYYGQCRNLSQQQISKRLQQGHPYAVRIKGDLFPLPQNFTDEVYGKMDFKALQDFIIVRRNGWPTFHLANVVDDWKMKITHVIRGQEWLNNTNKHIYLYQVLKAPVPTFVHLPLMKNLSGKKLAKRDGQSSAQSLIDDHYEVEAVRSFLYGMGMTRVDQSEKDKLAETAKAEDRDSKGKKKEPEVLRLLSMEEMIQSFKIHNISRVPVKFDRKHLDFLNKQALRKRWEQSKDNPQQLSYFINELNRQIPSSTQFSQQYHVQMLGAVIERLTFVTDLSQYAYYYKEPDYREETARKDFQKLYGPEAALSIQGNQFKVKRANPDFLKKNNSILHNLRMVLEHVIPPTDYSETQIAKHISQFLYQSPSLKNQQVFHLLRYVVSGRKNGPNITKACSIIGRDTLLQRVGRFTNLQ